MSITAGSVMDRVAGLLNDTAKSIYTYVVQVPYLNMALDELQETLEANNVPMSNETSSVLAITTVMTDIGGATGPTLPTDLIEIQGLYERLTGTTDDFILMDRCEFLPLTSIKTSSLIYWEWSKQIINFIGANTNRDVKIKYVGAVLASIVDNTTNINLFNAKSFLAYRTAGLCAEFVGENKERADGLNTYAQLAMDRFLAINTKSRQSIITRRRPFLAAAKVRGF